MSDSEGISQKKTLVRFSVRSVECSGSYRVDLVIPPQKCNLQVTSSHRMDILNFNISYRRSVQFFFPRLSVAIYTLSSLSAVHPKICGNAIKKVQAPNLGCSGRISSTFFHYYSRWAMSISAIFLLLVLLKWCLSCKLWLLTNSNPSRQCWPLRE